MSGRIAPTSNGSPRRRSSGVLDLLADPDRRSLGRSARAVRRVLRSSELLPALVGGLSDRDPLVRMRAADALEKLARHIPGRLSRQRVRFLRTAATSDQPEVQWHMAQLLPRLALTPAQRARARRILGRYLGSSSSIVQTMALDGLVQLAPATPRGWTETSRLLHAAAASRFPAVRARARRLRATFARQATRDAPPD